MPKIPDNLKSNKKLPCIACSGTGKSSKGGRCYPCNGTGTPYVWKCEKCGAEHHGFSVMECRNPKCPSNKRSSK